MRVWLCSRRGWVRTAPPQLANWNSARGMHIKAFEEIAINGDGDDQLFKIPNVLPCNRRPTLPDAGRLLEHMRETKQIEIGTVAADDLDADGQACRRKAGRH